MGFNCRIAARGRLACYYISVCLNGRTGKQVSAVIIVIKPETSLVIASSFTASIMRDYLLNLCAHA